jgi:hypothetical protein
VAPDFRGFFTGLRKVELRSGAALPALRSLLGNDLPPVLTQVQPFLAQLTPLVTAAQRYDHEITGLLGNAAGATQAQATLAESNNQPVHYLRTSGLLSPEAFSAFTQLSSPHRLTTNRANPYTEPGGALAVGGGLQSFPVDACPGPQRSIGVLDPATPNDAAFNGRVAGDVTEAQDLFSRIKKYGFASAAAFPDGNLSSANTGAPACTNQGPQNSIGQIPELTDYLHVNSAP